MTLAEGFEQAEHEAEVAEIRAALRRTQKQLAKAKMHNDEMAEVAIAACHDAITARDRRIPAVPKPARDSRTRAGEHALWVMTDWQGAKVTTSYNSEVMRERVMRFCKKATKITDIQRADHPVRDCTIALGGDMIEGLFNFPNQVFEIDATLFEQYVNVSGLICDVVRHALTVYDKVNVVAEWGNHGRIGSKRDAVPKSDNADRMTYELSRQVMKSEPRVTWADCPEDIQRIEIGNYRALLIHGDEVGRSGFASPMTMVRHVAQWKSGAYPWSFRDCYIGHYHTHAEWALPDGEGSVYQTGSTESDNRYARETMAASAKPSQRIHFIDPAAGHVTAQYKVWLEE